MKSALNRNYHFFLLGTAVLVAAGTTVLLITQSSQLEQSLKNQDGIPPSSRSAAEICGDASSALARLKKPLDWRPREDGASPFVSRPYLLKDGKLIDPVTGSEPLYPPVPNQWLINHHLDYTDMNILQRDPLRKGFTVLEEFQAGTDPSDSRQFPPLCGKLSYQSSGIRKSSYLLEFLGEEESEGRKEIQIKPASPLPNPAKSNRADTSTRSVLRGESVPGAPFLKVIDVSEKKKIINDTEYDFSELTLQNTLTGERVVLTRKNTSREYRKTPIELIESVQFNYQLSGGDPETFTVERGKNFQLASLDKNHVETYRLIDISKNGVVLEKDGKNYTVHPSEESPLNAVPSPTP